MQYFLYFLVAILSTTIGAITGVGGGVIIKPVMDMIGQYDAETIGIISSITVFAMACVSLLRTSIGKSSTLNVKKSIALPLATGAAIGGIGGEQILKLIVATGAKNNIVTTIQNIVLAVLLVVILIYMKNKEKIPTLNKTGFLASSITGFTMGVFSSFLGIGGGPINIALILFIFSFGIKEAAQYSIITILFSQISKLLMVTINGGFKGVDFSILPLMVTGAISGGFIGATIAKKISQKTTEKLFNLLQILIITICIVNIVRNI